MATIFAVFALCLVLWIVVSLASYSREAERSDIVTGYYVWPGEFVETGRERRADGRPTGKPAKVNKIEIVGEGEWR